MKNLLILALFCGLCFGTLIGCGNNETASVPLKEPVAENLVTYDTAPASPQLINRLNRELNNELRLLDRFTNEIRINGEPKSPRIVDGYYTAIQFDDGQDHIICYFRPNTISADTHLGDGVILEGFLSHSNAKVGEDGNITVYVRCRLLTELTIRINNGISISDVGLLPEDFEQLDNGVRFTKTEEHNYVIRVVINNSAYTIDRTTTGTYTIEGMPNGMRVIIE